MKGIILALFITTLLSCSNENSEQKSIQTSTGSETKKSIKEESDMFSLFGKKELKNYYISSPLQGVLVKNGKPMANTKIIRKLTWNDNEEGLKGEFITDENGRFDIPGHQENLNLGSMTEFVGAIELFAESDDEEHMDENFFWLSSKHSEENFSDIEKPLEGLICDLSREKMAVDIGDNSIYGRCTWDGMSEGY